MNKPEAHNAPAVAMGSTNTIDRLVLSDAEWQARLTPEQFRVTRQHGTERAFSGPWLDEKRSGPCLPPTPNTNRGPAGPAFSNPYHLMRSPNTRIAVSECTASKSGADGVTAISGMCSPMVPAPRASAIAPMAWRWILSRAVESTVRSGRIHRF